jgi:hypothetical protein
VAEFQISRSARHHKSFFVAGSFESSGSMHVFLRRCSTLLQAGGSKYVENLSRLTLFMICCSLGGPVSPANLLTLTYSR